MIRFFFLQNTAKGYVIADDARICSKDNVFNVKMHFITLPNKDQLLNMTCHVTMPVGHNFNVS